MVPSSMSALSVGLLCLLLYTYAGYPLLLALWARLAPHRLAPRADFEPTVSVCIAVHDGADYLLQKLQSLQALEYPAQKLEFLLYSDGSTDGTEQLASQFALLEPRLRVLISATRLGKPSGLNRLRAAARGEVMLMTDIRQTLAPQALRALLKPLSDPTTGCVSGSLVLLGNTGPGVYWRYEKFIRGCEARLGGMVGVSGSLYAIRRQDFEELPSDVLLDDMFVPLLTVGRRKRIVLSADAEAYDHAYADEQEFARKVRTLAGNYQLVGKLPWLLVPGKNPVWFQFFSHKLLRLVCPFALLGLVASSLSLTWTTRAAGSESAFWQALALGQFAFYGLAACGASAGRLGSLARTFVVLNAAAVVGLWKFVRQSQDVAW
jgi:poly-beta-1,6-N-acetyl-D-glucosamine synthase